jgi:CheY-like chemotaxis protein
VLKAIRTEGPNQDTPVVILTVVADRSLVGEYEIYDILGKPVDAESLLHTLRRARMPGNQERPILIIDDDPAMLKQFMEPFIERGYRAILETDTEQGLRTAEKENPAAVILDLQMPGLDGFHFLSRFRRREKLRGVPVIVWTALDLTEDQHNKLNAMVQGVVEKTSGVDALLAKFDACLKPLAKKKVA